MSIIIYQRNQSGKNRKLVKTPNVLKLAAEYYNCSTIEGLELEDEQGIEITSHRGLGLLYDEIMTKNSFEKGAFSDFTLALLTDTGWYQISESTISE